MAEGLDGKKLVVIGAGPGGYPAAFLASDMGMSVTLVDTDVNPGGVCLYRGCIPSKTLLHVAKLIHEARESAAMGVKFGEPDINVEQLRDWKNKVVAKLTGGLGVLSKKRNIRMIQGHGRFVDAQTVSVAKPDGSDETVSFDYAIIATGSLPARIPLFPDSPRVMDSTSALDVPDIPKTLLVVGGGYIGLELGSVYAALGSKVTVVEALGTMLPGVDRDLAEVLDATLQERFEAILLNTKVIEATEVEGGIRVKMVGLDLAEPERTFDRVLVAVGRRPNHQNLGLEHTQVRIDDHGFIETDLQRRTAEPTIFAIGDVAGQPMLAHKATYEAKVAVEAIAGEPTVYDPLAIPAVVFTDPELAWCGLTETQARLDGTPIKIVRFPWGASGRATTLGRNDGLTKLVLDLYSERILGMGICGVGAGELIAEGVLAVEMGARASDLRMTIHAHPTLSETVMEAAELFFGHSPHLYQRSQAREQGQRASVSRGDDG